MKTFILVASRSVNNFLKSSFLCSCARSKMDLHCEYSTESVTTVERNVKNVKKFIPKLTTNLHKGQCGRVGVIGGSFEYTGAPYFAAISALKVGVDLVHVFCCREAGPVIKSYSPELIVHPFLDSSDVVTKIEPWLERLHVLVIGPGMGRDADLLSKVGEIITHCKRNMKPPPALIIDADGLYLITEDINLIKDYPGPLILTPNSVEYDRLCKKLIERDALKVAESLNAIVVQKGLNDVISNGMMNRSSTRTVRQYELILTCDVTGSNRRCGGQGDVLSGCIAAFIAWLQIYFSGRSTDVNLSQAADDNQGQFKDIDMLYSWAVYGACVITRTCSRFAFEENGRGMTASCMISHIPKAFQFHFGMC